MAMNHCCLATNENSASLNLAIHQKWPLVAISDNQGVIDHYSLGFYDSQLLSIIFIDRLY